MEILFCDRCRESIPDAELDSGKAVRVGGRLYHVHCAFARAIPGPGRFLLLALALTAVAGAAYAVVRVSAREEPRRSNEVPAEWTATLREELRLTRSELQAALDRKGEVLREELRGAVAKVEDEVTKSQAGALERGIVGLQERLQGAMDVHRNRFEANEQKLAEIAAWVKEVRDLANRLPSTAPTAPPTEAAPPAAPPAPAEPSAGTGAGPAIDPEAKRRHDEEVAKWIGLLKDPSVSVAYSAAYKLKLLKDEKAVPALIESLAGHKDLWVRAESATALGAIRSADGVPALIEALEDKEQYVFASASDALVKVTGQDFKNFSLDPTRKERKTYQEQWAKWWKENEARVRERLKNSPPAGE